jgi:hypothetical protein
MNYCDKCSKEVPLSNDAFAFDSFVAYGRYVSALNILRGSRHLFQTSDCVGSPSRAQYLEGGPLDERPQYKFNPDKMHKFREAYNKLQEFAKNEVEKGNHES